MTSSRAQDRLLGGGVVIAAAALAAVVVYSIHAAVPFNAVELPGENSLRVRLWSPQGWKFFTRNPREDHYHLLRQEVDGHWHSVALGPNTSVGGWFGFGRAARAQGIEYGLLLFGIPAKQWTACTTSPERCLDKAPVAAALYNRTPRPTLCGMSGFVLQRQIPWAWAGSWSTMTMPSRVLKVMVKC